MGQRPLTENDHRWFCGRDAEIEELAAQWRDDRLTVLYGASGVGKTSLLRAGVFPMLAAMRADVLPIGRVSHSSTFPMAALPDQNPYTLALLASWWPEQSAARVSPLSISGFLSRREPPDRHGRTGPTLVAIDQAERLFTSADQRHRLRFVDELQEAMETRPRTHLLLSVRSDHLDDVLRIAKAFDGDMGPPFPVRPLDRESAIQAVSGPAQAAGRAFEPDAAGRLVDALSAREAGAPSAAVDPEPPAMVEPVLLQAVCRRMWDELPDEGDISAGLLPDVDLALADFCARTLAAVAADHDARPGDLLSWLRGFLPRGSGPAERHSTEQRGAELPDSVIRALEDQHLIKMRSDGSREYELLHPLLVTAIRRLGHGQWPVHQSEPEALLRAAEVALSSGEPDLAERRAAEAVRSFDSDDMRAHAEAVSFLGNVALQQGRPDDAAEHYGRAAAMFEALRDTESVGWLLAAVGMLRLGQGDHAAAVDKLSAAAARMPNDPMIQTELGRALWQAGESAAALAVLGDVLAHHGDTYEALRARAEIRADLGYAESLKSDAESARGDVDSARAHEQSARAYADSALRDLERIGKHARPAARAARALALATRSDVDAARRELNAVIAEAADSGPVLFRAAQVQRLSRNVGAATELASRAVRATDPPLPRHQKDEVLRLLREM
ncbi:tetratricopeptide repeat protein [Spirillospora sp. NPDC048911]|uniref:nSTAND1 domain-containing NTPase n=1 Tax=Spirillospora sp. NPDC048911 TaxID=3364527 RepID=UPI003715BEA9